MFLSTEQSSCLTCFCLYMNVSKFNTMLTEIKVFIAAYNYSVMCYKLLIPVDV